MKTLPKAGFFVDIVICGNKDSDTDLLAKFSIMKVLIRILLGFVTLIYSIFTFGNVFTQGVAPLSGYILIYTLIFAHIPSFLFLIFLSINGYLKEGLFWTKFKVEYWCLLVSIVAFFAFGITKSLCENCTFWNSSAAASTTLNWWQSATECL